MGNKEKIERELNLEIFGYERLAALVGVSSMLIVIYETPSAEFVSGQIKKLINC